MSWYGTRYVAHVEIMFVMEKQGKSAYASWKARFCPCSLAAHLASVVTALQTGQLGHDCDWFKPF